MTFDQWVESLRQKSMRGTQLTQAEIDICYGSPREQAIAQTAWEAATMHNQPRSVRLVDPRNIIDEG